MPQILVADVIVAARLQSLDFVKNYVAKVQIFPELAKLFSNYFAGKCKVCNYSFIDVVDKWSAFNNAHARHGIVFTYSFIQIRQEGFKVDEVQGWILQNLYYRIIIYYNI